MNPAAQRIRDERRAAGLTQVELARAAGTSQPAINRYERGAAVPSEKTLARLLRACSARQRRPRQVLIAHRDEVVEMLRRHGATQVLVFGSVARDEDDNRSDIDLLVDHLDPHGYSWGVPKVKVELEDLLGVPVDIGEIRNMRPRVLAEASRDARPL